MLELQYGNRFKKELNLALQRPGHTLDKLKMVLNYLVREESLPAQYNDHKLKGDYKNCRECHILPDWLLIYRIKEGCVTLIRTGSHSDLF